MSICIWIFLNGMFDSDVNVVCVYRSMIFADLFFRVFFSLVFFFTDYRIRCIYIIHNCIFIRMHIVFVLPIQKYKACTRFLVKTSKASSWKNFMSSIHNHTDSSVVWNKIKSLKRTNIHNNINLIINSKLSLSHKDVSNFLD